MTTINANTRILDFYTYPVVLYNLTPTHKTFTLTTYPAIAGLNTIISDAFSLSPGTIVELFELDSTALGDSIYYFHSGTNELNADVVWQGVTYTSFPIEADGFELSTSGTLPKPKLKVANIDGAIGALNRAYNDLVGAKLIRKRTLVKYLDEINFTGGVNPLADAAQYFPDDTFYVDRKVSENRVYVEYELASAMDVEGIRLPRRQVIQNVCPWVYRDGECGYSGTNYWDTNGNVVSNLASDVCGKKLSSCKLRFGEYSVLPYGGFPGAGLF